MTSFYSYFKSQGEDVVSSLRSFKGKLGHDENNLLEQQDLLSSIKKAISSLELKYKQHLDAEFSELDFKEFKKDLQLLYSLSYIECGDALRSELTPDFNYFNILDYFNKYAELSFDKYMYLDTFVKKVTLETGSSHRKIVNLVSTEAVISFPFPSDIEFLPIMGVPSTAPLYSIYWANFMLMRMNKAPAMEVIEHALINRIAYKKIHKKK